MPSSLSISGLCKSFHFFSPLFSCLCPILYLLVFLSVLYLAEQGPNLHSLWPLQVRDREKEGNSFGLLDGTEGWIHTSLTISLSLPQMLNTSQIGNRRRKQYCCQLSLSVCLPLHMIMFLQAEMFSHHLSNNRPESESSLHLMCF